MTKENDHDHKKKKQGKNSDLSALFMWLQWSRKKERIIGQGQLTQLDTLEMSWIKVWLVGFYRISTLVGY